MWFIYDMLPAVCIVVWKSTSQTRTRITRKRYRYNLNKAVWNVLASSFRDVYHISVTLAQWTLNHFFLGIGWLKHVHDDNVYICRNGSAIAELRHYFSRYIEMQCHNLSIGEKARVFTTFVPAADLSYSDIDTDEVDLLNLIYRD